MSKIKYNIADWLVHGGHQYEFFKTGHNFLCTDHKGIAPNPSSLGRPKNKNVNYVKQSFLQEQRVDIIMVRSSIKGPKYKRLREKFVFHKPPGIAVMQTTTPFSPPRWVRCIVWNSEWSMKKYKNQFGWAKHFYIPHGFDPNEFKVLDTPKNGKVLTAGSLFKQRGRLLGYSDWRWVASQLDGNLNLIGHGNDEPEDIGSHPLHDLVKIYNEHSVFLNTTKHSAMPRTRGEAMMCGVPIVTTSNYGISKYLKNNNNCIIANTKEEMLSGVLKILESEDLRKNLSHMSRLTAEKFFGINRYLNSWQHVFEEAVR